MKDIIFPVFVEMAVSDLEETDPLQRLSYVTWVIDEMRNRGMAEAADWVSAHRQEFHDGILRGHLVEFEGRQLESPLSEAAEKAFRATSAVAEGTATVLEDAKVEQMAISINPDTQKLYVQADLTAKIVEERPLGPGEALAEGEIPAESPIVAEKPVKSTKKAKKEGFPEPGEPPTVGDGSVASQ